LAFAAKARFDEPPGEVYPDGARLAPAMISTSGHRGPRRRQRGAQPAWLAHPGKREPRPLRDDPFGSAFAMAQAVARARWRRCFRPQFGLAFVCPDRLARFGGLLHSGRSNGGGTSPTRSPQRLARSAAQCQPRAGSPGRWAAAPILDLPGRWLDRVVSERAGLPAPTSPPRLLRLQSSRLVPLRFGSG